MQRHALTAGTLLCVLAVTALAGCSSEPEGDVLYTNEGGEVETVDVDTAVPEYDDPFTAVDDAGGTGCDQPGDTLAPTDIDGALYATCEDISVRIYNDVDHATETITTNFETNPVTGRVAYRAGTMVIYGQQGAVDAAVANLTN